jgi:hypothetical protein
MLQITNLEPPITLVCMYVSNISQAIHTHWEYSAKINKKKCPKKHVKPKYQKYKHICHIKSAFKNIN